MTTGTDPFNFLQGILNILVIDGEAQARQSALMPLLEALPCCTVDCASSNTAALQHLRSGRRFHVCITELGMNDVDNDEYYILRQYSRHSSIMVLTAQQSPAKGAVCMQLGARAVFDKGDTFDGRAFIRTFSWMAIINVVNCRYNEWSADSLNIATKIMFEKNPSSVTDWAEQMRITDRQLRNLWHSGSGFGAKQMLFLYDCLRSALLFYETLLFGNGNQKNTADKYFRKQYESYFMDHRELLQFILS